MEWYNTFNSKEYWLEGLYNMAQLNVQEWDTPPLPKKEIFFLYGTLKRGHRNHDLLLPSHATLIADTAVLPDFAFVEVCNGTPGAVARPGCNIYGEVWELSGSNIALLDKIEKGYTKGTVYAHTNKGNRYCSCYIWQLGYERILHNTHWDRDIEKLSMEKGLN